MWEQVCCVRIIIHEGREKSFVLVPERQVGEILLLLGEGHERQAQRLALAEKHLLDMEKSYERINKDLRDPYESYKLGMTDRETCLEQRKIYEQLLVRIQENIEKQKVAGSKMAAVDLTEVDGFEMLEGQIKLQKLNKEIVDAFVAEIVVHDKDRVEIKWKFRDEFKK